MADQLTLSLAPLSLVPSTSPFLSLAPELKQAIFSALPHASTLESLVLTCSNFYHTFKDAESLIIKSILHSQIGSHLLFDALIVLESRMLTPYNVEAIAQLMDLYAKRASTITINHQKWRLRHAVAASSLHDSIESLSKDFARSALATNIVTGLDEPSPTPLSLSESKRIKRTFYRYELFYSLFRRNGEHELNRSASLRLQYSFFDECEPWGIEQLRCVEDYLSDRLCLSFHDLATHDVEWGKSEREYAYDPQLDDRLLSTRWAECLTLGLSHLHQIFNTSSFEERCQFWKPFEERCQFLKPRREWAEYRYLDALKAIIFKQKREKPGNNQEELNVDPPSAKPATDGDRGPEEAWQWAHITAGVGRFSDLHRTVRKRGYVMWDLARLAAWGVLDQDWRSIPCEKHVDRIQLRRRIAYVYKSFSARREINDGGGRG